MGLLSAETGEGALIRGKPCRRARILPASGGVSGLGQLRTCLVEKLANKAPLGPSDTGSYISSGQYCQVGMWACRFRN